MSLADGGIDIAVEIDGGVIRRVVIDNRRPPGATRPLSGLPAGQAMAAVTRLFAVCRMAQGVAAVTALETAAGANAAAAQQAARRLLLLAETVLERSLKTCLTWPGLLGEAPLPAPLKLLRTAFHELHRDLYPEGDWQRPGGGRLSPGRAAVRRRLEAGADAVRLTAALALRLRQRIGQQGLADFGAAEIQPLPDLPAPLLARRMADEAGFTARPDWQGQPRFTGPLARRPAGDTGLLAHLLAAEQDLAASLAEMAAIIADLGEDGGLADFPAAVSGGGLSIVEAARGRLVHRLRLQDGRVRDYQVLAPTEWNFHPDGALVRGLLGRPAPPDAEFALRLLISSLDPCVDYRLTVRHA